MGPPTEVVAGAREALARGRELAGPGGVVIATGSLYLIADLLASGPREHASSL
jgi:dihydrofolate synthase/folylpolyglutamate synthase